MKMEDRLLFIYLLSLRLLSLFHTDTHTHTQGRTHTRTFVISPGQLGEAFSSHLYFHARAAFVFPSVPEVSVLPPSR